MSYVVIMVLVLSWLSIGGSDIDSDEVPVVSKYNM